MKFYYDDNKTQYEVAEQVKSRIRDPVARCAIEPVTVSDAEVKDLVRQVSKDRYEVPEERRASHILITGEA